MKLLKNKDFIRELSAFIAFGALAAIGLYLYTRNINYSLVAIVLALFYCALYSIFTAIRNRRIAKLSEELDKVLHGIQSSFNPSNSEGELSILESEIEKMTITLKEQSDALLEDKIRLTDAIADIFHQMRTPLTSMNLILSILSEEDLSYEKRIGLVRDMKKQVFRMKWLVESLLKMSKIDAGTAIFDIKEWDLNKVLKESAESLLVPMELKGVAFSIKCKGVFLACDKQWTKEAFSNLIKNAYEHTPEGGRVEIEVEDNNIFTQIVFKDSGEGFMQGDIPHLFERFYKGKNATSESIGIGLALSRSIIAAQNGTIKAENNPDGGACFIVKFYKNIV